MKITDYHACYLAHELTKRCSADSPEKLAGTLVDAQVDLNPHQVEAALFAFRSPLSKGALLADEVGLGKTIEAGLVISQHWAERKRRILVITPANLRKQWHQEMQEKFFLTCRILETQAYNRLVRAGDTHPFECGEIVICSYQFAKAKAEEIQRIPWHLVVIDEAHRLRNVYKPANVIANTLKVALAGCHKLLLTATPLQNSLLELFGLTSFVDEHVFGDLKSFREQFAALNDQRTFATLKARLAPVCKRTLRRQVLPYVKYTARHSMVEEFSPSDSEDQLYQLVSDYLRRPNLQALPASQRKLMTLVLRKLLASSTFAIGGTLDTLSKRLRAKLARQPVQRDLAEEIDEDYETLDETQEEWNEGSTDEPLTPEDFASMQQEVADLEGFRDLAMSITINAKGQALLVALRRAFEETKRLGGAEKAIIFTESRRTQEYLQRVLADSPWRDGIVLFNGSNSDEKSKQIYLQWVEKHRGTDRVSGSRAADIRSALVDYFAEQGQIMIATEAGAEGINLQFCSLVVNYDLPWNPQRIEQRIGRCHRYGQRHDVVVVNFWNRKNEADQRVLELLKDKLKLFEGVFGASDEVLGAIESGVDLEKRIADIYQRCRTVEEINASFDQLQCELSAQINEAMTQTRQQLLENFDDEVREKLRINDEGSRKYLNRYEQMLMRLTRHELNGHARFRDDSSFELLSNPFPERQIATGLYELPRRSGEAHLYRLSHPLAVEILRRVKGKTLEPAEITFDLSGHEGRVAVLEPLLGKSGHLTLSLFTVESMDQAEDHLIFAGVTDEGETLDGDQMRRLFTLPGSVRGRGAGVSLPEAVLAEQTERRQEQILRGISERNAHFFEEEATKLDAWADDLKLALEREIKDLDRQIKEARRASVAATTLEEKLEGQKQIRALESERNTKRKALFEAQDAVDQRREELITEIEAKLKQRTTARPLLCVRWAIT
ncbi:MAG: DEAD/DEAH box helicase family protein [Armatimonadetes bacterium]|nr:DEAD/DEAH box helicase family protein [Armatimonadota bacterium]